MPAIKTISKRDFLKYSFLGGCGICLAGMGLKSFGNGFSELAGGSFGDESFSHLSLIPDSPADKPWKWSKPALYFIDTPKGIKCKLCPRKCEIEVGKAGSCRTNVNYDGKLYSISYGNPCSVNIDPIEKKPFFHYLPGTLTFSIATAGCNLACLNCQNWEISQVSPEETRNYDMMPDAVVAAAKKANCNAIAYTYTDPVAYYEYTLDTATLAREQGMKNLMISAGYINPDPMRRLSKYLDAARIDLKSYSDEIYEMLNAGTLQPVLDTLKILKEEGVWLEIINLVIPTWTDDFDMIREMCDWLADNGLESVPLHFSRFQPLHKLTNLPPTPVSSLEKARQIAMNAGIKYAYIGNVPGHEGENTYCPKCKKMIIERKGFTILQNKMVNSKCGYCQEQIDGIWS